MEARIGEPAGAFGSSLVTVFRDGVAWWAVHADEGDLLIEEVPAVTR